MSLAAFRPSHLVCAVREVKLHIAAVHLHTDTMDAMCRSQTEWVGQKAADLKTASRQFSCTSSGPAQSSNAEGVDIHRQLELEAGEAHPIHAEAVPLVRWIASCREVERHGALQEGQATVLSKSGTPWSAVSPCQLKVNCPVSALRELRKATPKRECCTQPTGLQSCWNWTSQITGCCTPQSNCPVLRGHD